MLKSIFWFFYCVHMSWQARTYYLRRYCYERWIKSQIGKVGENVGIGEDLRLQGGGQKNISIGDFTGIGDHCILGSWIKFLDEEFTPRIVIGNHVHIGDYVQITAAREITIGDGTLTGKFVIISDNNHGTSDIDDLLRNPLKRRLSIKGPVHIGKNVWIGDKVSILSGVTVGEGAVIAANAVVTKDVPAYSIVAGVPAKVVKKNE